MKFFRWLKNNYLHLLCILITVYFILLSAYKFPFALGRLIESVKDFCVSAQYYCNELFGSGGKYSPTVCDLSYINFEPIIHVPDSLNGFKEEQREFLQLFIDTLSLHWVN